uniref:FERM domain-containing protein n=1 Tax=Cyanistes caeruleus TaxID=156563 RepID=A0A8C0UUE8_CYACU
VLSLTSEGTSSMLVPAGDHYTMTDFAIAYFREAHFQDISLPTASPMAEPSLLRLKARLCLAALMRFMGDQPKHKHQAEVQCIYEILQVCELLLGKEQKHQWEWRLRGWLLLNLLTGYFLPSKILMPYATKFLQLASSDPSMEGRDEEGEGRGTRGADGTLHVLLPEHCPSQKGHGARRLVVLMPGGMEYLTRIRTFTVAKELLQEICEQMGIGEQQEIQDFVLFAIRSDDKNLGKMVRPIKLEEYLHDYLLEDKLVTVTLRRLIWRTPLHFDNQTYTDVHYGQVSQSRTLPSRDRCGVPTNRNVPRGLKKQEGSELKEYIPKTLQPSISLKALHNHVATLLRTRQPLQPMDAKIQFIEHVMKLPFFGYTIFIVERISDNRVPVPCFFGVNKEEIILVDGTTQVVSQVIPLKELQKMRTLRPISDGGLPGLELSYGSPSSPRAMWVELSQVRSAWTCTFLLTEWQGRL